MMTTASAVRPAALFTTPATLSASHGSPAQAGGRLAPARRAPGSPGDSPAAPISLFSLSYTYGTKKLQIGIANLFLHI
jgi:hypothetical protein